MYILLLYWLSLSNKALLVYMKNENLLTLNNTLDMYITRNTKELQVHNLHFVQCTNYRLRAFAVTSILNYHTQP